MGIRLERSGNVPELSDIGFCNGSVLGVTVTTNQRPSSTPHFSSSTDASIFHANTPSPRERSELLHTRYPEVGSPAIRITHSLTSVLGYAHRGLPECGEVRGLLPYNRLARATPYHDLVIETSLFQSRSRTGSYLWDLFSEPVIPGL